MIDLHCHLLPGIDDGPETLEEAIAMARLAVANGITEARVTPHIHVGRWDNERAGIASALEAYREALDGAGIPLKLGFAGEVRLSYDVVPLIEEGRVPEEQRGRYDVHDSMIDWSEQRRANTRRHRWMRHLRQMTERRRPVAG